MSSEILNIKPLTNNSNEPEISGICFQTLPCKHIVEWNGKSKCWDGIKIAVWFLIHNKPIPEHFSYLEEIITQAEIDKYSKDPDIAFEKIDMEPDLR